MNFFILLYKGMAILGLLAVPAYLVFKSNTSLGRIMRYGFGMFLRLFSKGELDLESPYLSLFGFIFMADGWGKISGGIIQALHRDVSIGFVQTRLKNSLADVPQEVEKILTQKKLPIGKVILYTDCAWTTTDQPILEKLLMDQNAGDQIRIAYSMFETNKIPAFWKSIIHRYFDAVVVPDPYFIDVYKSSGIQRPIFAIPISVDYQHFLSKPLKFKKHSPMVFGDFGVFVPRKNHLTLLRAFAKAFQNHPDFILKLNGRYAQGDWHQVLLEEARSLGLTQVILTKESRSQDDYVNLFQTVDCYINLSKGEGFSIPVREAMAQGIPVICADNTALSTVCKSGLVKAVPSQQKEPAYYHWIRKGYYGHFFNCTVDDTAAALRDVHEHYDEYLQRAGAARQWAANQDASQLTPLYRTLVKPANIMLGEENRITPEYLMTDSKELLHKYQ